MLFTFFVLEILLKIPLFPLSYNNPTSLKLLAAQDNISLKVVYVKASDKTRLLRQLNREEEPNVHEIVRRFYTDEADFQDDKSFAEIGNSYYEIWNDDRANPIN